MWASITTNDAARHTARASLRVVVVVVLGLMVASWVPSVEMAPTVAATPLCKRAGCNCTATDFGYWIMANCSFENQKQLVEIEASTLPPRLLELEINDCAELRLLDGAFAQLEQLKRVRLRNVRHLRVRRNAFHNLSAKETFVEILDCGQVDMETDAFKGVHGPLSALISRCAHVIIQSTAFSWLLAITVRDVPRLELSEKAFSFEKPKTSTYHGNGPATTVLLQNVVMPALPSFTFPSSAAELRLVNVEVREVRHDAFSALQLSSVIIHNSSLHTVETGAFSERTFMEVLDISSVRIRVLAANAIAGAIQNLTIQHSRISDVAGGAVNITTASATIRSNVFEKVRAHGFVLKSWNRLHVDANVFHSSAVEAFSTQFAHLQQQAGNLFTFVGNEIQDFAPGAFAFAAAGLQVGPALNADVAYNRFTQRCQCGLDSWVQDAVTGPNGSQDSVEQFFNTSFCTVDRVLSKCFNVAEGYMNMRAFANAVCDSALVILCDEASQGKTAVSVVQNDDGDFATGDGVFESELDREKKVLSVIFLAVVSGVAVTLTVTLLMWLKRNGYCVQARILYMPSTTSCLTVFHRAFVSMRGGGGGVVAAGSISRLNVREYNEIQQQRQQRAAMLPVVAVGVEEDVEGEFVPVEDKWTQTLPEELTQELLQSLREKLDDPDNYSEARDMIEHLYDLIKVEESCANNNTPSTSDTIEAFDNDDDPNPEENLYDVIQLPISTPTKRARQIKSSAAKKTMCHVGTRAPSPDKLLPASTTYAQVQRARRPPIVAEYAQPRDVELRPEHHVYAELPGALPGAPPGAPPPVPCSPIPSRLHVAQPKGPSRPLSFLRTLGESLLTPSTAMGFDRAVPGAAEYAEPGDRVTKGNANIMANRPLPNKPDQGRDPGALT